ncbi:hypothetical protein HK102_001360 [Quaeritorhiza haematococci]|nr:hypothetical protein HK102_001360 [Quaeritorhiza haematococci]
MIKSATLGFLGTVYMSMVVVDALPHPQGTFNPITAAMSDVPVAGSAAFLADHLTGHSDVLANAGPRTNFANPSQQNAYVTGWNHQKDINECITLQNPARCPGVIPTNGVAGIANTFFGIAPNDPNSPATQMAKIADAILGKTPRTDSPPAGQPAGPVPGQTAQVPRPAKRQVDVAGEITSDPEKMRATMGISGVYMALRQQMGTELTSLPVQDQASKVIERMETVGMLPKITDPAERQKEVAVVEGAIVMVNQIQAGNAAPKL